MKPVIIVAIIIGISVATVFVTSEIIWYYANQEFEETREELKENLADTFEKQYESIPEPTVQMVPAPGFEDIPEMIVESGNCDESYPDVCIPYPPDLDCDEISYSNFRVIGNDPHEFDRDNDGIGCEVGAPFTSNTVESVPECDESYPDVCIPPYPPDLDCGEIGYSNFKVIGNDPHGFDRDNDGIGCES